MGAEGFFSEEQQEVKLFRTNNGPMNNYHKKKKPAVDHLGDNTVLRIKCTCNLLNKVIFIISTIFSCGLHVNIFYVKYLIQVSTKYTIACILYDPSYLVK